MLVLRKPIKILMKTSNTTYLGLDIGEKRVGVARGSSATRLTTPLAVLPGGNELIPQLQRLVEAEQVDELVIGLPRGLDSQETKQTEFTRAVGLKIAQSLGLPIHWQDEAGTTQAARERVKSDTENIDMHAAAILLEDYLRQLEGTS
jgi:putative Holliday junction resolvase